MQATRQLLRAAKGAVETPSHIPAPQIMKPAHEAPSPIAHLFGGVIVGLSFASLYKVYYWNWRKEVNQFYYDYDKTMAEHSAEQVHEETQFCSSVPCPASLLAPFSGATFNLGVNSMRGHVWSYTHVVLPELLSAVDWS
eukprot:TRINITY_DN19394_c0_g1_i3.p1 TRINITY_DN19394_c0_g1~~TRINITY_DN19394_c0_g1_i3.p1  ORF type:complete len:139 (+),score=11.84 TRINITY_DN19394_c0_g1_i3:200-616(+)